MSHLIDADKLKADFIGNRYGAQAIEYVIDQQPTVDAVEVVRCKDCMYRDGNACDYSSVYVRPNGYCQWGRRKEDETD